MEQPPAYEMPEWLERAIIAQGRVPVAAVQAQAQAILNADWAVRIEKGEPTLDQALHDRALFREHVAPYGKLLEKEARP